MKKQTVLKRIGWVSLILLIISGFFLPLPYYIEAPGSAVHLSELIEVNNQKDKNAGSYMLTTVSIRQATPLTYWMKYLPFHEGVTEEELFGMTTTSEEYDNLQKYYMDSSINAAIELAYQTAGETYTLTYNGIYVMSILPGSGFAGKLEIGDTVSALDGQTFKSSAEFMDYVKQQKVGQDLTVTYQRDGIAGVVTAPLMEMEQKVPGLGISLVDHTTIETAIPVTIKTDEIGGPSAGFMFALQVYTQLVGEDLRQGQEIAGTGTISPDGTIGRIGGIEKKVAAADKEGATIFFAPDDTIDPVIQKQYPALQSNYQEALKAAAEIGTEMTIVPVKSFQDAIDYLKELK